MTVMKIVGLFTKPLLFLCKGICHIVFYSAVFARFVQNPYTWAKIIMLLFYFESEYGKRFFLFLLLSICAKFELSLFLAYKSIGNIVLCGSLPSDIRDNSHLVTGRNCSDFCDSCVNVLQKVESLCLAHLSV